MGYGIGLLLLGTVAGYWVLERAETHKGDLRKVGQVLGWLLIVLSLVGTACRVWTLATGNTALGRKAFCPFSRSTSSLAGHSVS
jgi:hypothetical protein